MHNKLLAVATAALVSAIAAPVALAHTRLEASSPQANSVVSPAPDQVRLQFSDPLELPFSKLKLVDERGGVIEPAKIAIDPANAKVLVGSIPGLRAGSYRVQWSTVTRDGHKVKGEFSFQVKQVESEHALLQRAVTVVLNLSFAVLAGACAASWWLRARQSVWVQSLAPRLRRASQLAAAAAMLAYACILWIEAASMAEVPLAEAWPAVRSVITATHYGLAWSIGAAALLVVAAVSAAGAQLGAGSVAAWIRIAALAVLLYSRSMVSHAGAGGDFSPALAIDWLHLVLVSVWVGEVIVAGLLVLRRLPDGGPAERADCAAYLEALSYSATLALAGIVVTGLLGSWRVLESPQDLIGNPYGTALLLKVGLVLCAAALGGLNRFFVLPSLLDSLRQTGQSGSAAQHRFARILQVEALFLLAAILAAAVLTSTPPPMVS